MIRSLRNDILLSRLANNASVLFSANVIASLLGLVSLTLTARGLGVEQFGMLVLVTTYVLIVDRLNNFQSWQSLIKYGADALEQDRSDDFKSLIKFGFLIDGSTAILGAVIAASASGIVGGWLGWSQEHILMAAAYSVTVLFHVSGTPIAILRLLDKYKKIAAQQVYAALIKLVGVALAYQMDAELWVYLLVWALVDIIGNLLLLYFAHRELRNQKITDVSHASVASMSTRFSGIWGFIWTSNLHASVKLGLREVDIIVIGMITGPVGAGLYKIVKTIGSTVGKITDPLYQAIYPDLSNCVSRKNFDDFRHLIFAPMKLISVVVPPVILLFYLFGDYVIGVVLGESFVTAYWPTLVYLVGTLVAMITFAFHPALLALGKAHYSLLILIASTLLYLLLMYSLTIRIGLLGAAVSYLLFYVVWALLQFSVITVTTNRESHCEATG